MKTRFADPERAERLVVAMRDAIGEWPTVRDVEALIGCSLEPAERAAMLRVMIRDGDPNPNEGSRPS